MSKPRASIFENDDAEALDLSSFAPKTAPDPTAPSAEKVREIAEKVNFVSREARPQQSRAPAKPQPAPASLTPPPGHFDRRHRTGRNQQLNIKVSPETSQAFNDICNEQRWVAGYTLERSTFALQRELRIGQDIAARVLAAVPAGLEPDSEILTRAIAAFEREIRRD